MIKPRISHAVEPARVVKASGAGYGKLGTVRIYKRERWTRRGVNRAKLNPMGKITRITVHHSGSPKGFADTDYKATVSYLEKVRSYHRSRKWADIGYHYAVDPKGRVWECRDIKYQGAHVRNHNEHNIGVVLLGNFEIQKPTWSQLSSMKKLVKQLRAKYRVGVKRIYTHKEINPTTCPGRHLQPVVSLYRRNGFFL